MDNDDDDDGGGGGEKVKGHGWPCIVEVYPQAQLASAAARRAFSLLGYYYS